MLALSYPSHQIVSNCIESIDWILVSSFVPTNLPIAVKWQASGTAADADAAAAADDDDDDDDDNDDDDDDE